MWEDAAGDGLVGERLVGLTLDGNSFTFAQNNIVQTAGVAFAINGPWGGGPL